MPPDAFYHRFSLFRKECSQRKAPEHYIPFLNYNNGYEYEVSESYYSLGGIDNWHKFTSVTVNPLSTIYCKAYFTVPDEVANNTAAPLAFVIGNQEYTIR